MAIIKAYTDIEQSKKLAEILPLESADCFWDYDEMQKFHRISWFEDGYDKDSQLRLDKNNVCAWSLVALFGVLPKEIVYNKNIVFLEFHVWENSLEYINNTDYTLYATRSYNNPIDACYEMIIKLKELNLL